MKGAKLAIDYVTIPDFKKQNHHFVPRFWQRLFQDANGNYYKTQRDRIVPAALRSTMTDDWTYLTYNAAWKPTDDVENELSGLEARAAPLIKSLTQSGSPVTEDEWKSLSAWLGISTSRHPYVLSRYHPLATIFASELAKAKGFANLEMFNAHLQKTFGDKVTVTKKEFNHLQSTSQDLLDATIEKVEVMSIYDPLLPQTDALLARFPISEQIYSMHLTLLDAPIGHEFILGDNPLPNHDLSHGFTVPLSKNVALRAKSATSGSAPLRMRRAANVFDIEGINLEQIRRSSVAVASSIATLKYWVNKFDAS